MEAVDKKRIRQDKKNFLRRQYRQQARAAIFINDYVEVKHQEIYEEAVAFYNYVNGLYPEKKDLRKTEEFKALKLGFTFVAKKDKAVKQNPPQVYLPITTVNQENFTVITYNDLQTDTEQATTEQATAEQATTEQATSEQATTEQATAEQATTEQATSEQATTEQATAERATTEQATAERATNKPQKIMQLRIPLLPSSVTTQTVNIVTQEIVEENPLTTAVNKLLPNDIEPTLDEEIPEEAFNAILAELRQDPDLRKLMEDIEEESDLNNVSEDTDLNNILEEIVQDPVLNSIVEDIDQMDIDLPIDDRLEQELNWEAW